MHGEGDGKSSKTEYVFVLIFVLTNVRQVVYSMEVEVKIVCADGFDWDTGNLLKILNRGIIPQLIEEFFLREQLLSPDYKHSASEERFIAVGKSYNGRYMLVSYTMRVKNNLNLIRVVTARYMHKKEIIFYEKVKESI